MKSGGRINTVHKEALKNARALFMIDMGFGNLKSARKKVLRRGFCGYFRSSNSLLFVNISLLISRYDTVYAFPLSPQENSAFPSTISPMKIDPQTLSQQEQNNVQYHPRLPHPSHFSPIAATPLIFSHVHFAYYINVFHFQPRPNSHALYSSAPRLLKTKSRCIPLLLIRRLIVALLLWFVLALLLVGYFGRNVRLRW